MAGMMTGAVLSSIIADRYGLHICLTLETSGGMLANANMTCHAALVGIEASSLSPLPWGFLGSYHR